MPITVKINNIKVKTTGTLTVLQLCENLNISIPRFCYNSNLAIAGNCRMCLVEIKNSIKPMVSCALPLLQNMEILTDTPLIKKSRENILEFLLINHPLDCPICDQGGECDLQDQTLAYGSDTTKFLFVKRSVQNKNCGPFIKTIMTRCIHCTRCIRFSQNVIGNYELGVINRGVSTEITTFIKNIFTSELSGNLVDLCPVGALTFKHTAFRARSWEITSTITSDCLNSLCPSIRVDSYKNKLIKVLPVFNTEVNHSWISDKTRFSIDGVDSQRLKSPLVRKNTILKKISWTECFEIFGNKLLKTDKSQINVFLDNLIDLETSFLLKSFYTKIGIKNIYSLLPFNNSKKDDYTPFTVTSIKNTDLCLFLFCDLRSENILLNLLLKETSLKKKIEIYTLGCHTNQLYKTQTLGSTLTPLLQLIEGKHKLCKLLLTAKNPLVFIGSNFLKLKNNEILLVFLKKYISLNYMYTDASTVNFLETNLIYQTKNNINKKLCILHNTQTLPNVGKATYLVYQGTHLNLASTQADLIIPTSTYFEKTSSYINILFKVCQTKKILHTSIPSDWLIFKIFFIVYNNRVINKKTQFITINKLLPYLHSRPTTNFTTSQNIFAGRSIFLQYPIQPFIKTYYLDNTITKNSKLMALQTKNLLHKTKNFKLC